MKRIVAVILFVAVSAGGGQAEDRMHRVELVRGGAAGGVISVGTDGEGYRLEGPDAYDFALQVYAAARKGFRIANAWFFSGPALRASFEQGLTPEDFGAGMKRAIRRSAVFRVPIEEVHWVGADPVEACNENAQLLKGSGIPEEEVFSRSHNVSVVALVGFGATADREALTAVSLGLESDSAHKHKALKYLVNVECRPL